MATHALTARAIDALTPEAKRYEVFDALTPGLAIPGCTERSARGLRRPRAGGLRSVKAPAEKSAHAPDLPASTEATGWKDQRRVSQARNCVLPLLSISS